MMTKSQCVLVVDDDADIRRGAKARLHLAGYETLEACDGCEGFLRAKERRPDAVLLDVRMPKLDGLSTLSELQAYPMTSTIPVVMLSASLADEKPALTGGAKYFLRKPYQGSALIEALRAALTENQK